MRRLLSALATLALSACAGTETGNPSFEGELSYNTHTTNAAVAALSAGGAEDGGARVGSAWLVLGDARFVRADLCDAPQGIEPHATGIGAGDHANEAAARSSFELAVGDYCGLELPLLRATSDELPEGAPDALQGRSIVLGGTLADGTPFRIESARQGPLFVGSPTTRFRMDADGARVLVGFDVAAWLDGLDLSTAQPDAQGTLVVSEADNPALLQAFERNLDAGVALYRDTDGSGQVSSAATPIARAQ